MTSDLGEPNFLGGGKGNRRRRRGGWAWGGRKHGGRHSGRDDRRCGCARAPCARGWLSETAAGDVVTVTGLHGDETFRGRVMAMGILPGVTLSVLQGGRERPLLVALPGSRCVIDRRSSEMIAVRGARDVMGREGAGQ